MKAFDDKHSVDNDYSILYHNLDDIHLLRFISKKGIIDYNEVSTNLNYCGNLQKEILPFLNSLIRQRYVKPVNETNFKITAKGKWILIRDNKTWDFVATVVTIATFLLLLMQVLKLL